MLRGHVQCLQQPSAAFLRDAIGEVLAVSLQVAAAWNGDISPQRLCQLEESYVRHHQYVASVLATDAAHSMLPSGQCCSVLWPFYSLLRSLLA